MTVGQIGGKAQDVNDASASMPNGRRVIRKVSGAEKGLK
jgi:hypothetical protein